MARRTDFRINLEAALQLALVELAERPVARKMQRLGFLMEFFGRERRRRIGEVGREIAEQRDQQDAREHRPNETEYETHVPVAPLPGRRH